MSGSRADPVLEQQVSGNQVDAVLEQQVSGSRADLVQVSGGALACEHADLMTEWHVLRREAASRRDDSAAQVLRCDFARRQADSVTERHVL